MQQWAYQVIKLHNTSINEFTTGLQRAGLDGWELVAITNMEKSIVGTLVGGSMVAVLKRPATDDDIAKVGAVEEYWG